jgi:hypothetical protein
MSLSIYLCSLGMALVASATLCLSLKSPEGHIALVALPSWRGSPLSHLMHVTSHVLPPRPEIVTQLGRALGANE